MVCSYTNHKLWRFWNSWGTHTQFLYCLNCIFCPLTLTLPLNLPPKIIKKKKFCIFFFFKKSHLWFISLFPHGDINLGLHSDWHESPWVSVLSVWSPHWDRKTNTDRHTQIDTHTHTHTHNDIPSCSQSVSGFEEVAGWIRQNNIKVKP